MSGYEDLMLTSCRHVLEDVASSLLESYAADGPLFIGDEVIVFPPRRTFDEAQLLAELFFPKYFNCSELSRPVNKPRLMEKLGTLATLFYNGVRPYYVSHDDVCITIRSSLGTFAVIRERLKKDVHAAYTGDPAANSYTEIIRCYPGQIAIMVQRVAHELYNSGAVVYARELTELAHRHTGADIHPGAAIGEYFFLDHATGTVIGATAVIGDWCRIYQSVTVGALHFQPDPSVPGMIKKGYKRHPTIGSYCVIGSGAKLLGNIRIGDNVSIGANAWVQEDVTDNVAVFISEHPQQALKQKHAAAKTPPPADDALAVMRDPRVAAGTLAPSGIAPIPNVTVSPALSPPPMFYI